MKNRKPLLVLSLLLLSLAISACSNRPGQSSVESSLSSTQNATSNTTSTSSSKETTSSVSYPASEFTDSDKENLTVIDCYSNYIKVAGSGVSVNQDTITITEAKEYEITGEWNGRIIVTLPDNETSEAKLTLNGLTATCSYDSVINVTQAKKVTIKNQNGYENNIVDSDTTSDEDSSRGKAAIYGKCSFDFSGKGTLNVTSKFKHAISCTKKLTIENGNINVIEAADCGLKGNNSVVVEGGKININSIGDGIKVEEVEDETKGYFTLTDGEIEINTTGDGISAPRRLDINGGKLKIVASGVDTVDSSESNPGGPGGPGRPGPGGRLFEASQETSSSSSKGIKVGCDEITTESVLNIDSGDIDITSNGTAIHSQGYVYIKKNETLDTTPTIVLSSKQKGIQGHNEVHISDGEINVKTSTEGIESKNDFYIDGGKITVYATDDGLNVGNSDKTIYINDGIIDITTQSGDTDGIDSNGNLVINGGFTLVKGGARQGNVAGSIDTDGTVKINGGTVIALGGICETPSSSSSCNTVKTSSCSYTVGDYSVVDSESNVLFTFILSTTYSNGWISSEKFLLNNSYSILRNNSKLKTWTQSSKIVSA